MAGAQAAALRLRLAEGRMKRASDLSIAAASDVSKVKLLLATVRDLPAVKTSYDADYITVEAASADLEDYNAELHLQRMMTFEEQYYSVMAAVDAVDSKPDLLETSASETSNGRKLNVALPKIHLPHFDGTPQKWPNFANLFTTLVTENSRLSSVERLAYLKGAVSGEPLGIIQPLELSEANFEVAWDLLVKRYDNKRLIVSAHVEALFNAPSASVETPKSLRQLLNVISENLAALKALGAPVEHWDMILLPILSRRLDPKLQGEWELSLSHEFPKLENFEAFLEKHCRAQELVGSSRSKPVRPQLLNQRPQSSSMPKNHNSSSFVVNSYISQCCLCNSSHTLHQCPEFGCMTPSDRFEIVKKHRLCLNCLGKSHQSKNCPSTSCRTCGKKHHTLLHFVQKTCSDKNDVSATSSPDQCVSTLPTVMSAVTNSEHTILLSTVQVAVLDSAGNACTVRALLDSASQASFISEKCMQRLRLPRIKAHLPVTGLSSTPVNIARAFASIVIAPVGGVGPQYALDVFVLPRITADLPCVKLSPEVSRAVSNLKLADPTFDTPGPVDLLIGADLFPQLLTGGKLSGPPMALDSVFGWVLMGRVPSEPPQCSKSFCVSLFTLFPPLEDTMRRFWELEEFPATRHCSPDDDICERTFVDSHTRNGEGRYTVCLPFRASQPELGTSRSQAVRRLIGLERRLRGDPQLRSMYFEFMTDYLTAGHMEKIPPEQVHSKQAYYLPHHSVVKPESSTTKLRVVFDASAKTSNGLSLNDNLLTGPKLQRDIVEILSNFRLHMVAFTADIKQMYRQIGVCIEHQEYQRIVWRFADTDPIEDYWLKTVTFGVSAAPYLALRTLKQLACDESVAFPLASKVLQADIYVDDIVTGSQSVSSALEIQRELISCLERGGFRLRKFLSNHPALLDWLPAEDLEVPQLFCLDPDSQLAVKVLGLQWNPVSDMFVYKIKSSSIRATKRTILSTVAKIFDPLGWLSPLLMVAKHLLQVLWLKTVDWDSDLPEDLAHRWNLFHKDLPLLSSIMIPRCIRGSNCCRYELHGFSDSSELGYAAVVYLRVLGPDEVKIHLLMAKSKVAPLKVQSLPRLELCGALLLARLLSHITQSYTENITVSSVTAWTDSQVVLAWVRSSPHNLKTFVANRVSELQNLTDAAWWRHVPSAENPADCASRGLLPAQLLEHHLWWTGPVWLKESVHHWPSSSPGATEVDPVLLEQNV